MAKKVECPITGHRFNIDFQNICYVSDGRRYKVRNVIFEYTGDPKIKNTLRLAGVLDIEDGKLFPPRLPWNTVGRVKWGPFEVDKPVSSERPHPLDTGKFDRFKLPSWK